MSKTISVEHIQIKIGKEVLKLSLEDIRELKDILNKLFPEPLERYVTYWPPPVTPIPWVIQPDSPPWRRWNEVWCNTTNTLTLENTPNASC